MIFKLGIYGATGRMGQEVSALIAGETELKGDRFELVDAVSRRAGIGHIDGVPVRKPEDSPREPLHVWIDLSSPEGTSSLLAEARSPLVIGTTGLDVATLDKVHAYASKFAVVLSPNLSTGVYVLTRALRAIGSASRLSYQVIVEEEHHREKKDSPSGTAKALIGILEREGFTISAVHSIRAGGIRGIHRVRLISDSEELCFEHRAFDRRGFAEGALLAARFAARVGKPGIYSMDQVFGEVT